MKPWQANVLVALISIAIGLVLAELGLRFLGIEYPNFYDYDPHFGHTLRPGTRGYWLKEGGGYVSINSDGLRDREHATKKPPNTLRIAVLGDSYSEALQVNQEEAFWAIMEKELQSCKKLQERHIEVLNFGVTGFGTTQELLMLRHKVWEYSPDIVLLAFYTGNDVADNVLSLKQEKFDPYFIRKNDDLILDDSATRQRWEEKVPNNYFFRPLFQWLIQFRVMQVVHRCKGFIREWWSNREHLRRQLISGKSSEPGLKSDISGTPTNRVWQEAWKVTEEILVKMRDEVIQKGARFLVVVLTTSVQVHPDVSKRTELARSLGVGDLLYPDRRVERFCQSHGIPVLLLAPPFQEYAALHQVFLHGFEKKPGKGHWNQNGHRLAGQAMAKWLCPQLD